MTRARMEFCIAALASSLCLHCGDDDGERDGDVPIPTELTFELRVGGEPLACGEEYPDVGEPPAPFTVTDARFYVSSIELVDAAGRGHAVTLTSNAFQGGGVALLDFEDGCGPDGTAETNTSVTGLVAPGDYRGLRFTLGVPQEKNFLDLAKAAPPLDVTGMFWTWLSGYKFLKVDGSSPMEGGGIYPYLVHVGAAGCPGDNAQAPPTGDCVAPNLVRYDLDGFRFGESKLVADLADVLATTDLSFNTDGTAPGCMSELDDPECRTIFERLGIDDAERQLLFSLE
jgi:uncharacterized repeat protein (TIGR04052 family)